MNQAKIAAKLQKFLIELANIPPKDVLPATSSTRSLSVTTEGWCPSLLWRTTSLSSGMMPAMCRPWWTGQCGISLLTGNTDSTFRGFAIAEGLQQGTVAINHPQVKSSQVSPNDHRQAQCKDRVYKNYTTCRHLSRNVEKIIARSWNPGNTEPKRPIGLHFS